MGCVVVSLCADGVVDYILSYAIPVSDVLFTSKLFYFLCCEDASLRLKNHDLVAFIVFICLLFILLLW